MRYPLTGLSTSKAHGNQNVRRSVYPSTSYYSWEITGKNMLAMACQGTFFLILNILIEYRFFYRQRVAVPRSSSAELEEDVAAERNTVLKGWYSIVSSTIRVKRWLSQWSGVRIIGPWFAFRFDHHDVPMKDHLVPSCWLFGFVSRVWNSLKLRIWEYDQLYVNVQIDLHSGILHGRDQSPPRFSNVTATLDSFPADFSRPTVSSIKSSVCGGGVRFADFTETTNGSECIFEIILQLLLAIGDNFCCILGENRPIAV